MSNCLIFLLHIKARNIQNAFLYYCLTKKIVKLSYLLLDKLLYKNVKFMLIE